MQALRDAKPVQDGAHGTFRFEDSKTYGPAFVSPMLIRKVKYGKKGEVRIEELMRKG